MTDKIVLSFREYLERQEAEAFGGDNTYYYWEKNGRSPNPDEAMHYYVESGGAKNFSEKYIPKEAIKDKKD